MKASFESFMNKESLHQYFYACDSLRQRKLDYFESMKFMISSRSEITDYFSPGEESDCVSLSLIFNHFLLSL